jgi:folate-binding protein YgfZ
LHDGAALVDPAWRGRLLLTGADRRSYLQGLLSNDIEALTPGTGCYATMLNAQGRMLADMRVFELGDAVLLLLPAGVTASVRDHLERFVITEDVQVQDLSASRTVIGLYGPRADDVLERVPLEGKRPVALYASSRVRVRGSDALLLRDDDPGTGGYEIVVDPESAPAVRDTLRGAGAISASESDVETVRIERGQPRFGADMDTDTIPLEAGLDRAMSRTKGCYVGQEVIVRVIDRGHGRVARRLVGLVFDPDAPVPTPGTRLTSGDREIGRVTSAAWSPALGHPIALGYVQRDFVAPGTPVKVGPSLGRVAELPFFEGR